MSEQRRQTRANVDRVILVKLSSGETIKARLINLSIGGLAIRYPAPGEAGALLGLMFQLPEQDELITINAQGVVRHSHIYHEDFVTGIEFVELDELTAKHINQFLSKKLGAQHPSGFVVSHRHQS